MNFYNMSKTCTEIIWSNYERVLKSSRLNTIYQNLIKCQSCYSFFTGEDQNFWTLVSYIEARTLSINNNLSIFACWVPFLIVSIFFLNTRAMKTNAFHFLKAADDISRKLFFGIFYFGKALIQIIKIINLEWIRWFNVTSTQITNEINNIFLIKY